MAEVERTGKRRKRWGRFWEWEKKQNEASSSREMEKRRRGKEEENKKGGEEERINGIAREAWRAKEVVGRGRR